MQDVAEKHPRSRSASNAAPPKERLSGIVVRLTYQSKDNDYRVIKLEAPAGVKASYIDARGEVVVVGHLPGIAVGECIEAEGQWMVHSRHGPQFKADWFKPSLPNTARGIEAYLSSGAIKGVGPVIAKRIAEKFGEKTFEVLDNDIDRLRGVKGVTRKRLDGIKLSWVESRVDRELITFLGEHGISPSWAHRLRKVYGEAALSVVRSNPYRLAAEVRGIGFGRADAMARRIGLAHDAPERIEAGLGHALEREAGEGHTFLLKHFLIETATELLDLDQTLVENRLENMLEQKKVLEDEIGALPAVFLLTLHAAETECARRIRHLAKARKRTPKIAVERNLDAFETRTDFRLAPHQREAVLRIAREGALVLTGGPGTGKTTTLRAAIEMFKSGGCSVRLAAPTGRAARRLAETTHERAETIHRLLGFQPRTGKFLHDSENPLEADLVVIDEVSMLDVLLARDLFCALRPGTCLLLVGDEDQLPSVGPGNVLGDIIASEIIPVVRLSQIFRQAESSLIVTNAHRVNQGEFPDLNPPAGIEEPDFFFVERAEPAEIVETIKTLIVERIPNKFNFDPIRDVQVLTPMRRGELGVDSLNRELQMALNRGGMNSDSVGGMFDENGDTKPRLRVGDRVLQTVNRYDKDVSNGDIGTVRSIDADLGEVMIEYEGRTISYLSDEVNELTLAYAITIHKSQGSEYPAVVIPMHMQHYVMLQRNLLYTALTRGRRLVCLVGSKRALWRAVNNSTRDGRNSALETFIRKVG